MAFKVELVKMAMNLLPSKPTYDIIHPRSETIRHKNFINGNEEEKRKILFTMAKYQYLEEQKKPSTIIF